MSSHHVVRDKQEPALIIANGEACSISLLHELLEWSPYVVVLDGAMHRVMELGIKVDVLLGDFDRNEIVEEEIRMQQDSIEIVHTPNQDKTDLEKGIDFLIERGHKAVNILWATGKRADHSFSNVANLVRYRGKITLTMLDDYSCIYLLPRAPESFQKWYKKESILSLIPIGEVQHITTENLKYNLNQENLSLGYRNGNSNEVLNDGIVKITYESGDLILMECHD
jgi:thiamine pyrophosphokinase